ncbi:hypothetical protein D4764_13G0011690 [Takifugu flavidus]|uniref:Uncharacterized protein n=1 Tax=Takifugu flavidus TaxID=433684 RepID=A0A5C6PDZ8_9TELE|nr:hypothetical protein D4764_13G0011690 [Takifugu flavidus]
MSTGHRGASKLFARALDDVRKSRGESCKNEDRLRPMSKKEPQNLKSEPQQLWEDNHSPEKVSPSPKHEQPDLQEHHSNLALSFSDMKERLEEVEAKLKKRDLRLIKVCRDQKRAGSKSSGT